MTECQPVIITISSNQHPKSRITSFHTTFTNKLHPSPPAPSDPPLEMESFFDNILKPGSSLNPTFLLIVDGAFTLLLGVFLVLVFLTAGNIHIFALMGIELALWASVKW